MNQISDKRKIFFTVILLLIVLLILVSGLELTLQAREFLYGRGAPVGIVNFHPLLEVVATPNPARHINMYGFKGDAIEIAKPENTYRIFTLGGSTTLSDRLDYKDTYPAKLEEKLQDKYPDTKIVVQNAAFHWYTTRHSVINYIFMVRKFQPDLIIVFHGINDLARGFSPPRYTIGEGGYKDDYSHFLGPLANLVKARSDKGSYSLFSKFLLFDTLKEGVTLLYTRFAPEKETDLKSILTPVEVKDFKSINSFRNNLDLLIKLVKMDNHSIIVGSQPFLYHKSLSEEERKSLYYAVRYTVENGQYADLESMIRGMEMFNRESYNVAQKNNVPFVDLASYVPKNGKYFIDDLHMTKEGTEIVAQLLYDYIVSASLIK